MKLWDNALNGLSEEIIEENLKEEAEAIGRRIPSSDPGYGVRHWIKWIAISAAVMILIAGLSMLPGWIRHRRELVASFTTHALDYPLTSMQANTEIAEAWFEKAYRARISEGSYKDYVEVRVCEEKYVGELLGSVTVEAGWQNGEGQYVSEVEHLRAQVYALKAYSPQAAICLKFIDKGDALTTEHYYVYRNPASSIDIRSLGIGLGWWSDEMTDSTVSGGTVTGYTEGYSIPVPTTGTDVEVTGYSAGYAPAVTTGTEGGE